MPRQHRLRRLITGAFTALAALTSTAVLIATPASASYPYYYMAAHDNLSACIDVQSQNGHVLQLWHCSGASEQTWAQNNDRANEWFEFRDKHFGHCIAAVHTTDQGGAVTGELNARLCTPLDDQTPWDKWKVQYAFNDGHWYQVWYNLGDANKCLARLGGTANGTRIGLLPCDHRSPAQQWTNLDT
ncbi:MAG: hypothetical protein ACXV5Q_12365 [Frankiaceae bacterium]